MIITRTPFRVSFFGGGTDYPAWYRLHGGAVLATTIDKYCYITCRYLPPFFDNRHRIVYSRVENCQTLDQIEHPAVREGLRQFGFRHGVEIHHEGDLPARRVKPPGRLRRRPNRCGQKQEPARDGPGGLCVFAASIRRKANQVLILRRFARRAFALAGRLP